MNDDMNDEMKEYSKNLSGSGMRWADMQSTWDQAARELGGLRGFAETVGWVGRAREVVGEARSVVAG